MPKRGELMAKYKTTKFKLKDSIYSKDKRFNNKFETYYGFWR